MIIREVMTPNPRSVSPSDSIQNAACIMRDEDAGAVPVVDNGRAIGIVTDRDIVVRVVAEGGQRRLPVVENDRLVGIVSIGDLAVKEGKDGRIGDTLQHISEGVKERE